jgi:hypothetical protein
MRLAISFAEIGERVAEIGNDGRDAPGRGAAQRIGHDQQFHQMIVRGKRCRLDDERVLPAHVLLHFDENFHIRETADLTIRQRESEIGRNGFGQRTVGIAREKLHDRH